MLAVYEGSYFSPSSPKWDFIFLKLPGNMIRKHLSVVRPLSLGWFALLHDCFAPTVHTDVRTTQENTSRVHAG